MTHDAKLNRVAEAVATALDVRPAEIAAASANLPVNGKSIEATIRLGPS